MAVQVLCGAQLGEEQIELGEIRSDEDEEQKCEGVDRPGFAKERDVEKAGEECGEAVPEDVTGIAASESGGNDGME